jgi:hypothetical protein
MRTHILHIPNKFQDLDFFWMATPPMVARLLSKQALNMHSCSIKN